MCTVTWLQQDDGYEVFCNRDELKTRKPALPPREKESNGVRYLAPVDADAGGSWIGVNEFGLTLCLVNHYPITHNEHKSPPSDVINLKEYCSRGLLLTELLESFSPEAVATKLEHETIAQYRSFILLAFGLHAPPRMFVWDEKAMHSERIHANALPITSSSFKTAAVIAARQREYREKFSSTRNLSAEQLASFHRSHSPERGAYSICMHRADAETVSFTRVRLTMTEAELQYSPHAPCAGMEPQHFRLRRTRFA